MSTTPTAIHTMVNRASLLHGSLRSPDLGGVGTGLSNRATAVAAGRHSLTGDGGTERLSVSQGAAVAIQRLVCDTDLTSALPTISAPTLVIAHAGNLYIPPELGRVLAEHITAARHVELAGEDHLYWVGDVDGLADEIEEFLTGTTAVPVADRLLATVLVTDNARLASRCTSPPESRRTRARPDPGLTDGRRSRRRVRHRLPRSWRSRPQGRPPTMAAPRRRGLTRPATVSNRALDHRGGAVEAGSAGRPNRPNSAGSRKTWTAPIRPATTSSTWMENAVGRSPGDRGR